MMKAATASILAIAVLAAAPLSAEKGKPEITAQTARSGGVLIPEQAALRLDKVDLSIELFPDREQILGTAIHSFTALRPSKTVVLDLDRNLPVSSIWVNDRRLRPGSWANPEGRLSIALPRATRPGHRFTVKIEYGGTPHVAVRPPWDGGFMWEKTAGGKPWIATAVQGEGCDLFWPCIDNPLVEPAVMDFRITVPAGLSAPANGVLRSIVERPDGRRTFHWRAKSPNAYGIAINVGPYKLIETKYRSRFGNLIPLQFWHLEGHEKQAAELFSEFAPMMDFYEATIGPYPFGDEKAAIVETPHLGMEHQTINAYGNNFIKETTGYDWLFQHEFAHEWFANQLTGADQDSFWLHEGFGSYMQPLYSRWRGGEHAYHALLAGGRTAGRHRIVNDRPMVIGSSGTGGGLDSTGDVYAKGAWMLHTLREHIGDRAFFDATRRLVYGRPDPRPGNFKPRIATSDSFREIVNQVTGKDWGWFFDVYLNEAALPDLVQERQGDTLRLRWVTPNNKPFPMPVEVDVDGRRLKVAMDGNSGSLPVPAGAHIVLDPGAKILRRSIDIEKFHAWQKEQAEKAEAAKKAAAAAPSS
jgi:aminopeptidase N